MYVLLRYFGKANLLRTDRLYADNSRIVNINFHTTGKKNNIDISLLLAENSF
jgi:hypothetical protein